MCGLSRYTLISKINECIMHACKQASKQARTYARAYINDTCFELFPCISVFIQSSKYTDFFF